MLLMLLGIMPYVYDAFISSCRLAKHMPFTGHYCCDDAAISPRFDNYRDYFFIYFSLKQIPVYAFLLMRATTITGR